jgi:hypothetical protein
MASLAVPEWIEHVAVATDNDVAGLEASRQFRMSLFDAGFCSAKEHVWGEPGSGWDAADEWKRRQQEKS